MLRFNTQECGLEEGFAQPLYRIQLETTNEACFETIQEIIRLYLFMERANMQERAERMKQYSAPSYKSYDVIDAKMPEPSGCGVIMTSEGVKQTK